MMKTPPPRHEPCLHYRDWESDPFDAWLGSYRGRCARCEKTWSGGKGMHCSECHAGWSGERPVHCPDCHETFSNERAYEYHLRGRTAELTRNGHGTWSVAKSIDRARNRFKPTQTGLTLGAEPLGDLDHREAS